MLCAKGHLKKLSLCNMHPIFLKKIIERNQVKENNDSIGMNNEGLCLIHQF